MLFQISYRADVDNSQRHWIWWIDISQRTKTNTPWHLWHLEECYTFLRSYVSILTKVLYCSEICVAKLQFIQHIQLFSINTELFYICRYLAYVAYKKKRYTQTCIHTCNINLMLQVAIQMTDSKTTLFNTELPIFVKRIYPWISKKTKFCRTPILGILRYIL